MTSAAPRLPRTLGLLPAASLLVGGVVGSGIFAVPGAMLHAAPSVPVCLAIWLIAGAISFLGSLTFAELGSMLPEAGGEYVYLREAYGPGIAFLYGWVLLAVIQSGSISAVAVTFGEYFRVVVGVGSARDWGLTCIAVCGLVTLRTTDLAIGLQTGVTATKVAALALIGVLAALSPTANASALWAHLPERAVTVGGVGLAVMQAMWAYDGWNAVSLVAGEVREPERNLPRALLGGLSLVVLLYVGVFAAYVVCLGPAGVDGSKQLASDVGQRVMGSAGAKVMAGLIALSTFGTTLGMMFTCPRTYYAMAQDKLFFAPAGWVHGRWGTPWVAVLLQAAVSLALALHGSFSDLLDYVMFASWLFYGLTATALFVLRARSGKAGPFPTPGYPVTPLLFCAISLGMMVVVAASNPGQALYGSAWILCGLPLYLLVRAWNR